MALHLQFRPNAGKDEPIPQAEMASMRKLKAGKPTLQKSWTSWDGKSIQGHLQCPYPTTNTQPGGTRSKK